ncbi:response regulator [Candidatus Formimonas warabiya]|uniref:Stage 0 sporulation protein A homolog n=1 Tax=Formimonas warabiya TaxID=1761012 RepID=A0A3G1KPC1_FORW1|nr:response regulator [Candidatus Formimonas warabiya]ATW24298.1 hypothetical protein DCMF_05385 [Candidatus Formimonas warabiya]
MRKLKVLVVDDEMPARETLSFLINWKETAFEIAATAKDGRDALDKYYSLHPDLIITDIQMPVMDGLALIKTIRQENSRQKFIVLSCHEKFSYAREAIQMGVTDYLIKDLITPQDLYAVLVKVEKELEEQKTVIPPGSGKNVPAERDEFDDALRNMALKTIILENVPAGAKQSLAERFGLNLTGHYFVLLLVQLDDYEKKKNILDYSAWKEVKERIYYAIKDALEGGLGGECFYYQNGQFILIARLEEIGSQLKFISQSYEIADRLHRKVRGAEKASYTIGISQGFYGLTDVPLRYREALEVIKYKIFFGKGKILFYNKIFSRLHAGNKDMMAKRIIQIQRAIDENNRAQLSQEVRALYREDVQGFMQYNYLKETNAQMYGLIAGACHASRITYADLFGCNYIPLHQLDDLDTASEMGEWFQNVFVHLIALKEKIDDKKYSRHIKDAMEYIAANYRRNIGLRDVAKALNLHKVYLCRLFKQETGENLINYILKVRLEEAKRMMLSTNHKLYEIAEQVGYPNIQQFSVVFKKLTGVTPREFRNRNFNP